MYIYVGLILLGPGGDTQPDQLRTAVGEYAEGYNLRPKLYSEEDYADHGKYRYFSFASEYYLPNYRCLLYAGASYMTGNSVYSFCKGIRISILRPSYDVTESQ